MEKNMDEKLKEYVDRIKAGEILEGEELQDYKSLMKKGYGLQQAEEVRPDYEYEQPDMVPNFLEAAGLGLGQGATFGYFDELVGGVTSAVSDVPYEEARDFSREQLETAREEEPVAAYGGELAGGVATGLAASPLTAGKGLGALAAQAGVEGAIYGAGTTEANIIDEPVNFIEDVVKGGVISAAVPPALAGLAKGAGKIGKGATKVLTGLDEEGFQTAKKMLKTPGKFTESEAALKEASTQASDSMKNVSNLSEIMADEASSSYASVGKDMLDEVGMPDFKAILPNTVKKNIPDKVETVGDLHQVRKAIDKELNKPSIPYETANELSAVRDVVDNRLKSSTEFGLADALYSSSKATEDALGSLTTGTGGLKSHVNKALKGKANSLEAKLFSRDIKNFAKTVRKIPEKMDEPAKRVAEDFKQKYPPELHPAIDEVVNGKSDVMKIFTEKVDELAESAEKLAKPENLKKIEEANMLLTQLSEKAGSPSEVGKVLARMATRGGVGFSFGGPLGAMAGALATPLNLLRVYDKLGEPVMKMVGKKSIPEITEAISRRVPEVVQEAAKQAPRETIEQATRMATPITKQEPEAKPEEAPEPESFWGTGYDLPPKPDSEDLPGSPVRDEGSDITRNRNIVSPVTGRKGINYKIEVPDQVTKEDLDSGKFDYENIRKRLNRRKNR